MDRDSVCLHHQTGKCGCLQVDELLRALKRFVRIVPVAIQFRPLFLFSRHGAAACKCNVISQHFHSRKVNPFSLYHQLRRLNSARPLQSRERQFSLTVIFEPTSFVLSLVPYLSLFTMAVRLGYWNIRAVCRIDR